MWISNITFKSISDFNLSTVKVYFIKTNLV